MSFIKERPQQYQVQNNPVSIALAQSPYTVPANISEVNVNTAGGNVRVNLPNSARKITVNKTSSDNYLVTLYVSGTQIGEIAGELSSVTIESGQITKDEPWYPFDVGFGFAGVSGDGGELLAKDRFGRTVLRAVAHIDDATLISNAINLLFPVVNLTQNFHCHFGSGTYFITHPIIFTLNDDYRLNAIFSGNGRASQFLVSSEMPANQSIFSFSSTLYAMNTRNFFVEHLGFYGGSHATAHAIQTSECNSYDINHCMFYDFGAGAPIYGNGGFANIHDNRFYQLGGNGIEGTYTGSIFSGNNMDEAILGCGMYLHLSERNAIVGNNFNGITGSAAIYIFGNNLPYGVRNTISGNTIKSDCGIFLSGARNTLISGNAMTGMSKTSSYHAGIVVQGCGTAIISHNDIQDFDRSIAWFGAAPDDLTIVYNNLGTGIYSTVSPVRLIVRGNRGYITENSGSSTGTGSEQTIAHGLAAIPTGCKAWIKYLVGTRYITEMVPFDATNIYPTVETGVAYEWRIE